MHTLIPFWVYALFECAATVATLLALARYTFLFPWWAHPIGRHRFALYLSIAFALTLTAVSIFIGYYPGALIVGCAVFAFIVVVMVWANIQMSRVPRRQKHEKGKQKEASNRGDGYSI